METKSPKRTYIVMSSSDSGHESASAEINLEVAELSRAERLQLHRDPQVKRFAPALPVRLIEPVATADGSSTSEASGAGAAWGIQAVRADASPYDGEGVTVAVLDTGIDATHPAFAGVELTRRNFTSEAPQDLHGHGTHCAGTIFGRDVGGLRIGVAPGIKRALIGKVLGAGGGSSASIASAIQWAASEGANVISMSLGIDFAGFVAELINEGYDAAQATSLALEGYTENVALFGALAGYLKALSPVAHGCIIVSASGNASARPEIEIGAEPPAASKDIIAVGALQKTSGGLSVANFSNRNVDLAAPGVSVVSAWPGGGLRSLNGTSMATPHVAGVAALWAQKLLQSNGALNPAVLTARLIGTATAGPLSPGSDEDDVGTGVVQAPLS